MAEYKCEYKYEGGLTVRTMSNMHVEVSINGEKALPVFGSDRIDYYRAKSDFRTIEEWYDMVSTPIDEEKHMRRLEWNAGNISHMYSYLEEANAKYKPVNGLTRAECLVVLMYTGDAERPFYRQYNKDSAERIWEDYKMYTRLLLSALMKLVRNPSNRPPSDRPLYRGIRSDLDPPAVRRFFFKTFTSTTLNMETAEKFAGRHGIILKFIPPHSRYAVKVGRLSSFPEEEVLIPPFVAFDVLEPDRNGFYRFKTSETQEFLA